MLVPHGGAGAGFTQPAGLDERIGKKLRLLECFARELLDGGGTPLRAAAEIGRGAAEIGRAAAEIGRAAISLSRCDADRARCDLARCDRARCDLARCDLARIGVTRWRRTRHALVCEVGRALVQAAFVCGCELLIAPDSQCLVFVDRAGVASRHRLSAGWPHAIVPTGVEQVDKRLRYVTELVQAWDRLASRTCRGADGPKTAATTEDDAVRDGVRTGGGWEELGAMGSSCAFVS